MAEGGEPTTLRLWALVIARTMERQGLDAGRAFEMAGLGLSNERDADARYPLSNMTRLWRAAAELSGDPAIGLKVAGQVQPASLHALGLVLLASETLGDVFQRLERYSRVVTDGVKIRVQRSDQQVTIRYDIPPHGVPIAPEALDALIGMGAKLARMLSQKDVDPVKVDLTRPRPTDVRPYREWFRAPIEFAASQNALHYSPGIMTEPLPAANPVLVRVNEQIVVGYLSRIDRDRISQRVRSEILERLNASVPKLTEIATLMNMSPRGLQRRLHAEQTSYKAILDQVRQRLAEEYLQRSSHSLGDITYMLGFDDQSNFTRAFKRWTGTTPRQYRGRFAGLLD